MNPRPKAMSLRAEAALVLSDVRESKASLGDLLPRLDTRLPDARDRAQARAILYAALRGIYRYEAVLALLLARPLPRRHARVEGVILNGLAQLEAGIDAPYAVVDGSVRAARELGESNLAGLVNATLRRFQREREALLAAVPAEVIAAGNHPAWMLARFRKDYGDAGAESIVAANNAAAPLWLRNQARRQSREQALQLFAQFGLEAKAHPHLPDAFELPPAGDVTQFPGFGEGAFSVQDASAQLAVELLDLRPGLAVLDACCAPGGKLAAIASRAPDLAQLVGVDVDAIRIERTREGLARLGLSVELKAVDLRRYQPARAFDRILVDAPCSGTGVIRRHPDIRLLRRDSDIEGLVRAQAELLDACWPMLVPGGRLVYATCSVLHEENTAQVEAFLQRHPDAEICEDIPEWFGQPSRFGRQNLPGMGAGDGFYYAVLRRRPDPDAERLRR